MIPDVVLLTAERRISLNEDYAFRSGELSQLRLIQKRAARFLLVLAVAVLAETAGCTGAGIRNCIDRCLSKKLFRDILGGFLAGAAEKELDGTHSQDDWCVIPVLCLNLADILKN